MREVILNSPKQFMVGLEKAGKIKQEGQFNNIIICGLGGSAMPGILLTDYLPDIKMPVYIYRGYGLPTQADKNSLIISISFSGNTEETISGYEEAVKRNLKVIAITTGGKLKELAEKDNLPVIVIPNDCLQPRLGTSYLFSALLKALANSGVIEDKSDEILETAGKLEPIKLEDTGKLLAKKLMNKIPVVYSSNYYKSIARIWKIKFNENSKIMAFWNYFPELNHNEMVGLTQIKPIFHFLILKDVNDNPKTIKRMELFKDLAEEKQCKVDFIEIHGSNKLEKMFNTLILGDWVSYYLALEYKQDPAPVKIVEEFKKRLKD